MKSKQKKPSNNENPNSIKKQNEQRQKPINIKTHITPELIAEFIKREQGNISAVAKCLNITRLTVYERIKNNQWLQDVLKETREEFTDFAESKLLECIECIEPNTISSPQAKILTFYLGSQAKDRGYAPKTQIELQGDINANINGQLDLTYMTIEEKQKYLDQLKQSDAILESLKNSDE